VTAYVLSVLLLVLIVANMILNESAASADGNITVGCVCLAAVRTRMSTPPAGSACCAQAGASARKKSM